MDACNAPLHTCHVMTKLFGRSGVPIRGGLLYMWIYFQCIEIYPFIVGLFFRLLRRHCSGRHCSGWMGCPKMSGTAIVCWGCPVVYIRLSAILPAFLTSHCTWPAITVVYTSEQGKWLFLHQSPDVSTFLCAYSSWSGCDQNDTQTWTLRTWTLPCKGWQKIKRGAYLGIYYMSCFCLVGGII